MKGLISPRALASAVLSASHGSPEREQWLALIQAKDVNALQQKLGPDSESEEEAGEAGFTAGI